jgi:hypothetical protein
MEYSILRQYPTTILQERSIVKQVVKELSRSTTFQYPQRQVLRVPEDDLIAIG